MLHKIVLVILLVANIATVVYFLTIVYSIFFKHKRLSTRSKLTVVTLWLVWICIGSLVFNGQLVEALNNFIK